MKSVLVTGGAGYIGSHTCLELISKGHSVVVVDNLCNSSPKSIKICSELSGFEIPFHSVDIRETAKIAEILNQYKCDSVIHFAGLKAVGESNTQPIKYYDNNVTGTVSIIKAMHQVECRELVFSSSATVYGEPQELPLTETHRLSATNPYGRSKLIVEDILRDLAASDPRWHVSLLRYFNPCGAHPSGRIGEDPNGIPNNLMPFVSQVAVGRRNQLSIWGSDYPTKDGTGVRDYVHVVDLARGHVAALEQISKFVGGVAVNLGTGRGYSVNEVVEAFRAASGAEIPVVYAERRQGDVAASFANCDLAYELLDWRAEKTLDEMCADHWKWQSLNPNGYSES